MLRHIHATGCCRNISFCEPLFILLCIAMYVFEYFVYFYIFKCVPRCNKVLVIIAVEIMAGTRAIVCVKNRQHRASKMFCLNVCFYFKNIFFVGMPSLQVYGCKK